LTIVNRTYTNDIWKILGSTKKTPILAVTGSYTFSGYLNHASDERVLDVLNQGSMTDKERLPEDFLQITEVEVVCANGQKQHTSPSCLVAKSNILFVAEKYTDEDKHRLDTPLHPLYQPKKSVCVEILMPGIAMLARVHICDWQRPMSVVNTVQMFLPLTGVEFSARLSTGEQQFDFIAINRSQIVSMEEVEPQ
jgi:hypothetical protein